MKVSMWMLADRLAKYNPRVEISGGSQTITGVRFINGTLSELHPEYLYAGRASDVFFCKQYHDAIILVHQYDFLVFYGVDWDELINEVLGAFEFYDKWEQQVVETSRIIGGLEEMVMLFHEVLGNPMFFLNHEGRILAYDKNFSGDSAGDIWQEIIDSQSIPTNRLGSLIISKDNTVQSDWTQTPQIYRGNEIYPNCIAANIYADDEFLGSIVIPAICKPLMPHHCQLALFFCQMAAQAATDRNIQSILKSTPSILYLLLEGDEPDESNLRLLLGKEWTAPWYLLIIRNVHSALSDLHKRTIVTRLRKLDICTTSLLYGSEILVVVDKEHLTKLLQELQIILNLNHFSIGVSLPFSEWKEMPRKRGQALYALEQNSGCCGVFFCKDYAFQHLLFTLNQQCQNSLILHPAPEILSEYDRSNHTEFFQTLYAFLQNDRSLVAASAALHIHRNTLLYRIKKIQELIGSELDDPDERVYIQLSYKLFVDKAD